MELLEQDLQRLEVLEDMVEAVQVVAEQLQSQELPTQAVEAAARLIVAQAANYTPLALEVLVSLLFVTLVHRQ